ncbi:hypothetical protein LB506_009780 [Fusarium annulatum]|nr:hypothetical protein LB506_009780 [Fusarium annulatum]
MITTVPGMLLLTTLLLSTAVFSAVSILIMATLAPSPTLARTQARTATFSIVTQTAVNPLNFPVAPI